AAVDRARAAVQAAKQNIAAAEADDQLAQATLKRYQSLQEKKAVSPHEFDEVQARSRAVAAQRQGAGAGLAQAMAAQAQAEAMLSYTRIRAPFDGVVTARNVDPGAQASPGTPLLTVEDTRRLRLDATVDESALQFVKLGAAAPVAMDALQSTINGKVTQIVPAADAASRSFVVKIELAADARLHSGMFGRARFARGVRQVVMVPRSAVLDHGQLHGVYLVGDQGTINLHYVTLGTASGDNVEILSGLSGGERMIASPAGRELAGKKLME
ncbi:MAG TPA: efflux RND transporter periplasmic adaptor subunit, partial [Ramlibacter sp.]|nr:efflux RND transporter periplasmic adaptor subunit [Ramlibacter sp.]